ncbi:hypothetical protein J1P26_10190 [Neobacillus sp. MM2021_6]|uniref:hypothetical protein n=1 Tax=Bacillaceae TaxID=186817 RepID=UPI00140A210F|nr:MULTISPECIES: hypothetical protein [Bacillaceae]MBO0960092.1 hypothetical protein [Neobacillus sp. MM2021_6]NHC17502.1 hypothetical protein [Bacillus sp. MM2020_4]WML40830.1 hypothetical protein RCG19_03830 [Neobacillus sp. OS1-2]
MKKNRYLLCLLLCGFMLYFAVPKLSVTAEGTQGIFAIVWLSFALIVIAGNLTGLLYSPKKLVKKPLQQSAKRKTRSY